MEYHKQAESKPADFSTFNLKRAPMTSSAPTSPVPPGGQQENTSQVTPAAPTGLNAFLQQLQQSKPAVAAADLQPVSQMSDSLKDPTMFKRPLAPICKTLDVKMDVTSLPSANDVEMLSARSTDGSKESSKTTEIGDKSESSNHGNQATADVASISTVEPASKPSDAKLLDAKAQIRAALLSNAGLRKQRNGW